jgi:signal peptidase II
MFNRLLHTGKLSYLWISILIIILDQASKLCALSYLTFAMPIKVFPGLNFSLVYNYGAAFSFLDNSNEVWQVFLFSIIAIVLVIFLFFWLARLSDGHKVLAIGLCLILGGAIGNLYDRLAYGYVIDFIDCYVYKYHWPVFNIADMAICIGAFFVIISSFKSTK